MLNLNRAFKVFYDTPQKENVLVLGKFRSKQQTFKASG